MTVLTVVLSLIVVKRRHEICHGPSDIIRVKVYLPRIKKALVINSFLVSMFSIFLCDIFGPIEKFFGSMGNKPCIKVN